MEGGPLKFRFSCLFSVSLAKDVLVANMYMLGWHVGGFGWSWHYNLFEWEENFSGGLCYDVGLCSFAG